MGYIRYQTYQASSYLVKQLSDARVGAYLLEDGGDIIQFELRTGHIVSIHLIESGLPLYEIRNTLHYNAERGVFTLFVLWARLMLPHHAQVYDPEDWMHALLTLYGDRIYGYDVFDGEVFVFPVHFRGAGRVRTVEYGTTAHMERITCRMVETALPGLEGRWRIAALDGQTPHADHDPQAGRITPEQLTALEASYALLGVTFEDDRETIKKAYRLLARRYHPDTNTSDEANGMMQQINDAYRQILDALDGE